MASRKQKVKKSRTEKEIKNELQIIASSKDGKIRGFLLVWCIFTGVTIVQAIPSAEGAWGAWAHIILLSILLILAIKGRGSKYLIFVLASLSAILLSWGCTTITAASLQTNCIMSDLRNSYRCTLVPNYVWENEARMLIISGAIAATYHMITAFYFCFSKRVAKHFFYSKRRAELQRELKELEKS